MAHAARGQTDAVRDVVAGSGSCVVRSAEPDDLAVVLADALEGELIGAAELGDAISRRLEALRSRTDALAALAAHAQLSADTDGHRHIVSDVSTLRDLLARIDAAHRFVGESRAGLRERAGTGSDLAVHPETIRKAAAEVIEARSARRDVEVELDDLLAVAPVADAPAPADAGAGQDGQRRAVMRAAGAVAAGVLGGVISAAAIGSPIPLLLAVVGFVWAAALLWRYRQDVAGRDVASDNLAAVSALTDRAYGGVPLAEPGHIVAARTRLAAADERLRYAESSWASLVGPDVDVADLDQVLAGRDAQWHVGDAELAMTPTLRAAEAYVRRLRAQWKLAWWAMDRDVPARDRAAAALDELDADGVDVITVPTWRARAPERAAAKAELERLADGRTVDELRVAAAAVPQPLVVLDEAGDIGEAELAARTALLPPEARVVVVGPSSVDQTG